MPRERTIFHREVHHRRRVIKYPTKSKPDCRGKILIDPESDQDVIYVHYQDFCAPKYPDPINATVSICKHTNKMRVVRGKVPHAKIQF